MRRSISFLFIQVLLSPVFGQTNVEVYEQGVAMPHTLQLEITDSLQLRNQIETYFLQQGFLFFHIDSIRASRVYAYLGTQYPVDLVNWRHLQVGPDTIQLTHFQGYRNFESYASEYISNAKNNGYPFARIDIDSSRNEGDQIVIYSHEDAGPLILLDSLVLTHSAGINRKHLYQLLRLQKSGLYQERDFEQIPSRIDQLPYLELNSPPDVSFESGMATVYLDLKPIKANRFEGVLGLLPKQAVDEKLAFTGYLNVELMNLFRSGKSLNFFWNRFADQSQTLNLSYQHPYVLGSVISLDAHFDLTRQDSLFLNQGWQFNGLVDINSFFRLKVGSSVQVGTLINPDIKNLEEGLADYRRVSYQMEWAHINPYVRNQFGSYSQFAISGQVGNKRISRNLNIPETAYDTIQLKTLMGQLMVETWVQQKIYKGLTIHHEASAAALYNDLVLRNEMFRLGGLKTLRGFNENNFYVNRFALSRLEFRQYFEPKSYVMLFWDQSYFQSGRQNRFVQGIGIGFTIDTSNGLFTFASAYGIQDQVSQDISSLKIHFGYHSKF